MKVQRSKVKWASLATWFDSEGTIGIGKNYSTFRTNLQICNTNPKLMKWLVVNFGGNVSTREFNNGLGVNKLPIHLWSVYGAKNKEKILLGILPYLILKKEQALVQLEYVRLNGEKLPEKRHELWERSRKLNHSIEPVTTNTSNIPENGIKIESELIGDDKSEFAVTQISKTQL